VLKTLAEDEDGAPMISERELSKSFSGFWGELLPLLTPSFVHFFNETFKLNLVDAQGLPIGTVKKASDLGDTAFLAEVAFYLVKLARQHELSAVSAWEDVALRDKVIGLASATVDAYEGGTGQVPSELGEGEREEVLGLAHNYDLFLGRFADGTAITFNPRIQGSGFISSCEADISVGNVLYEVKTVSRNLAGKDLRQVIIYLALQAATGERRWTQAGFFNPRRATVHEFNVDDLVSRISGGRLAVEVFRGITEFALTREVEFDSSF
jgi:hypothetical protein